MNAFKVVHTATLHVVVMQDSRLFLWLTHFYAPHLYWQVLLRRILAVGILSVRLSVRLSVCHDPVVYQAQVR